MISVITPVFNQSTFTKQYLNDMKESLSSEDEIIIVNNGSTDNTKAILDDWNGAATLLVVDNEKNEGFAKACNQAYSVSIGNNVIFLNNDIKTKRSDWFYSLLDAIEDDSIVGYTGGYVDEKTFNFKYETQDLLKKINYISGWCVAGNRKTFERMKEDLGNEMGPFIEDFKTYFEDTYMGFQCKRLNIKMKIAIPADVVHFGKMTSRTLNTTELYLSAKAKFTKRILQERKG